VAQRSAAEPPGPAEQDEWAGIAVVVLANAAAVTTSRP
jgi:hypothetical protein